MNSRKKHLKNRINKALQMPDEIDFETPKLTILKFEEVLIENYKDDKNFYNILNKYNDIVLDTIRGEIIDVVTPYEEKNKIFKGNVEDTTMDIYRLKTSYYTLVGPMSLGMILANSKEEEIKDIEEFTLPLGIAFQIHLHILTFVIIQIIIEVAVVCADTVVTPQILAV